jgi:N-acetylglutamate synthase-like GNAT family acetyltransferase
MSGAEVVVRRADVGDAEDARRLVSELGYGGLDVETFAKGFAAVLAEPSQSVWVAEEGGAIVGMLALSAKPQVRLAAKVLTIDEIVVREASRGRGVGATLMAVAKREAVREGARRLELHTQRARESYARGFYEKQGFVEIDSAVMRWEGAVSVRMA